MGEISKAIGQFIVNNVSLSVLILLWILSGIFKLSKIEIDPVGKLVSWIGKHLTNDLRNDVETMKTNTDNQIKELKETTKAKLSELEDSTKKELAEIIAKSNMNDTEISRKLTEIEMRQDEMTAARIKNHVLTFSRRCRKGEKHTKEDFQNLIKENEQYEQLTEKHGWKNDVYKEDYAFFMEEYRRCLREDDFLA